MLVKYLGTVYNEDNQELPRIEFLENGLFRITQPKFLNDKNETKFRSYPDKYSPADLKSARKQYSAFNMDSSNREPTKEDLINFYLRRTGIQYSPENFPTLLGFTDYSSVEEYKDAEARNLKSSVESFNRIILEVLSSYIGIFSLTKNLTNELMWTHYASEGRGIAVCFNESHPFFKEFEVQRVSYNQENRASISLMEGILRIDGEKYNQYDTFESFNSISIYKWMIEKGITNKDLSKRLFYTKTEKWSYEEERRMVIPLELSDKEKGSIVEPLINGNFVDELTEILPKHHEICLKKIPFEAIEAIVFGYDTSKSSVEEVISIAKRNPELSHLKFKKAKMDTITEKIEVNDLEFSQDSPSA